MHDKVKKTNEPSPCLLLLLAVFAFSVVGCSRQHTIVEPEDVYYNVASEEPHTSQSSIDIMGEATLHSSTFSLNGIIYTLPVHFSELEANGWSFCEVENEHDFATYTIEPGDFDVIRLANGDHNIFVFFTNFTDEISLLREVYITGVSVLRGTNNAELIFPGNIIIGSTYEEVLAVHEDYLGYIIELERAYRYGFRTVPYSWTTLSVQFDVENLQVTFMQLDYWGWLELSRTLPPTEVDIEPEPVVDIDGLSHDLKSREFYLDGVIYTLPFKISELRANGWDFCEVNNDEDPETYILEAGERTGWWRAWIVTNGEQFAEIRLTNLSESKLPVSESYVDGFATARLVASGLHPVFPGNITIGSSYETLVTAHGEPRIRWSEYSFDFSAEFVHMFIRMCCHAERIVYIGMVYLP